MSASRFVLVLLATFLGLSQLAGAAPYDREVTPWWERTPWVDPERGFHWYPPDVAEKPIEKQAPEPPKPKSLDEMTMEEVTEHIKSLRETAILNPTEANVSDYLQAQTWMYDKGATFADVARRVAWTNPAVNYNNRSPVANYARLNEYSRKGQKTKNVLRDLASEHGVLFFARSDCHYCEDQAPVLKVFEREYGLPVLAISLDGGPIHMYPDAKPDNGISAIVSGGEGISVVPTLYLVNRSSREAIPLGSGVIASDDLAERIRVLTTTQPGEEF